MVLPAILLHDTSWSRVAPAEVLEAIVPGVSVTEDTVDLADTDVVIEAVAEDLRVRPEGMSRLDAALPRVVGTGHMAGGIVEEQTRQDREGLCARGSDNSRG